MFSRNDFNPDYTPLFPKYEYEPYKPSDYTSLLPKFEPPKPLFPKEDYEYAVGHEILKARQRDQEWLHPLPYRESIRPNPMLQSEWLIEQAAWACGWSR